MLPGPFVPFARALSRSMLHRSKLALSGDIQRTTRAAVVKGSAAAAMPVRWLYRRGSQQTYSLPTS